MQIVVAGSPKNKQTNKIICPSNTDEKRGLEIESQSGRSQTGNEGATGKQAELETLMAADVVTLIKQTGCTLIAF